MLPDATLERAAKSMHAHHRTQNEIAAALGVTPNQAHWLIYKNTEACRRWRENARRARRPFEGKFLDPRKGYKVYDGT